MFLLGRTIGKNSRAQQGKYHERKTAFISERRGIVILANRTTGITPPGASAMRELANDLKRSGVDVINFAAGELDGDASDLMKTAAKLAIDEGCNKYTPTLGTKRLRERVAELVSTRCGVPYGADEIGVTAGAKQALYNSAMILFNPGDEVIIPQPYWVTFPAQVQLAGASPVFVDTARTGYQLASEDLERAITPATKAIIINSPNNPTGVIYEPGALRRISHLALERKIWIIFDECYSELVRAGATHRNVVQLVEETKRQTILINSFSKSHAVTGWRIGYACGPKHVISAMESFQGHTTSNACTISQHAAAAALQQDDGQFIRNVNAVLEQRLRIAMRIIGSMSEISCAPANGAFYLFLNVAQKFGKSYRGQLIPDVGKLCELMLREVRVAVVPGDAFGDPTGLRVSYAIETSQVEEGLQRMSLFFDNIV
jgi:aspartate aminotransferase